MRQWAVPRGMIVLLGIAAAVIVGVGLQAMAWLIGPMFLALVVVISVNPLQTWLRRHGCPGWAALLALVVAVYALLIGMLLIIVVSIARLATELPQYADRAQALVTNVTNELTRFGVGPDQLREAAHSLNWGQLVGVVGSMLSGVAGIATNVVFLLTLVLFLIAEVSGVGARLRAIAMDRPDVAVALAGFASGTRKYMVVSTVFGLIVAVLDTIALLLMGVPLAVTWGLLAFITNYIPNIGFVLGLIPPALLGLLAGGPSLMVAVIVVYCVLNFVVQTLIQPRFVGDSVGLSVTVTFVSLLFWAWLIGPIGAVLAIPLTLLAKALLVDIDPSAKWADALLAARPARAEPAPDEEPDVPAAPSPAIEEGEAAAAGGPAPSAPSA